MKKVLLVIMDGVGISKNVFGDAVKNANTKNLDYLKKVSAYTTLRASRNSCWTSNRK